MSDAVPDWSIDLGGVLQKSWKKLNALDGALKASAAANIAFCTFCTLCMARPSSVAGIRCVHISGMCRPLSYSVTICPLTPASSAQARPPARMCSRTTACCGLIVT